MTEPIDWTARLNDALQAAENRRERNRRIRAVVAATRTAGLAARHTRKLARVPDTDPLTPRPEHTGAGPHSDLGAVLTAACARRDLSMSELSRLVGASPGYVSGLLRRGRRPSRVMAYRLIVALGLVGRDASIVAASSAEPGRRPA